jgi:hypothetical protein
MYRLTFAQIWTTLCLALSTKHDDNK